MVFLLSLQKDRLNTLLFLTLIHDATLGKFEKERGDEKGRSKGFGFTITVFSEKSTK